jgi:antitoxin MazE
MTVQIRKCLTTGLEVWRGIIRFYEWNLAEEDARAGFGDAMDLAQGSRDVLSGNDQQDIVANDYRGAFCGNRKLMTQPLARFQVYAPENSNFIFGGEQTCRASDSYALSHPQQTSIAAADIDQVVSRLKSDRLDDLFVDAPRNLLLVSAAKRQIVRVAGMPRGLATIFHVVIGAGNHSVDSSLAVEYEIVLRSVVAIDIQWSCISKEDIVRVAKWGNSLAVRLPAAVVEALDLKDGDDIEIRVAKRRSFEVKKDRSREQAFARLIKLGRPLPKGFVFDREEAHER